MGTDDAQKFMVRDPQGNVYGPADVDLLEQWVMQGRIVPGMHIAPRDTGEWAEVSTHPALAHLFPKESAPQETPPTTLDSQQAPPTPVAEQSPTPTPYATPIPTTPVSNYPVTPVRPGSTVPLSYTSVGPRQNVPAFISLGAGIAAVFFGAVSSCLCLCIPVAVLAALASIVSGAIALMQIKNDPSITGGRGQAIAGIVLGVVGVLLMIVLMAAGVALHFRNP